MHTNNDACYNKLINHFNSYSFAMEQNAKCLLLLSSVDEDFDIVEEEVMLD